MDFKEERLAYRTKIRIFQVMDEATRFFLGAWWDRSIDGKMTAEYFDHLCRHYGPPEEIRRDDGPEFRSKEFQRVCRKWRVRQRGIPPGSPYWTPPSFAILTEVQVTFKLASRGKSRNANGLETRLFSLQRFSV